jgi:hypothetical protein
MSATRQQVVAALDEFRQGRAGHTWRACIAGLLRRFGGGATSVDILRPELYENVLKACGALPGLAVEGRRRPATPLVVDLERRAKQNPAHPRPTARVDFGNRTLPGERRD